MTEHACTKCGEVTDNFYERNKSTCKECLKANWRKKYHEGSIFTEETRELRRIQSNVYYYNNRERLLVEMRERYHRKKNEAVEAE